MTPIDAKNQETTIRTIAKIAGVSHTTVSRALNDSPAVKAATKSKIKQIADEIGYVPNLNAKGLANSKSYMIGLFFSNLHVGTSASFLSEVVDEINWNMPKEYSVSLNEIDESSDLRISQKFDGVVVVSQSPNDDQFLDVLAQKDIPMVVLNRKIDRTDLTNIAADEYSGAKGMTEYAIRMGHRKFGIIKGIQGFDSTEKRLAGFVDALNAQHLALEDQWIIEGDYLPKSGYEAMRQILSLEGEHPDCVFSSNDDMTIGALKACKDMGYRVPQDISIFGYDDIRYSKYLTPALTTVRKPIAEIAKRGSEVLMQMLESPDGQVETIQETINSTLVIRETVSDLNE